MTTKKISVTSPDVVAGDHIRIVRMREVKNNTYEVVTESGKYGVVKQMVLMVPGTITEQSPCPPDEQSAMPRPPQKG